MPRFIRIFGAETIFTFPQSRFAGLGNFTVAAALAWLFLFGSFFCQETFISESLALDVPWLTGEKMQIRWETDLNRAKAQASATGKPLLLHFFSETCPPCKMMERKTFPDETIIGLVAEHYIAVKVNTTRDPQAAKTFDVRAVPADLIFTPDMRLISRTQGGKDPNQYAQYISQIANQYQVSRDQYLQQRRQQVASANPPANPNPGVNPGSSGNQLANNSSPAYNPPAIPAVPAPPAVPAVQTAPAAQAVPENNQYANNPANQFRNPSNVAANPPVAVPENRYANAPMPPATQDNSGWNSANSATTPNRTVANNNLQNNASAANSIINPAFYGTCPVSQTPSFDYSKLSDSAKRRLEFDGNCPVELTDRQQWVRGNPQLALGYEGRIYFFAGMEQLEKFRKSPNQYAPALSGLDIVSLKESGRRVQGVRDYGAWTRGRVFLFSSETNLVKFERDPLRYIN